MTATRKTVPSALRASALPSSIISRESFWLSASGKIDRCPLRRRPNWWSTLALPVEKRISHEGTIFPSKRGWESERGKASHKCQVWDSIFYDLWHTGNNYRKHYRIEVNNVTDAVGEIFEDHREVWLPGSAVGEIHHSEWWLSAQNSMIQGQKSWTQIQIDSRNTFTISLLLAF